MFPNWSRFLQELQTWMRRYVARRKSWPKKSPFRKRPAEHVLLAVVPWICPAREPKEVRHGQGEEVEAGRDT